MPPHAAVDYSKWDHLDDDDDVPARTPTPSSTLAKQQSNGRPIVSDSQRQANHHESMRIIADWVKEAYERIPAENVSQLIKFITLQHKGIYPDNTKRAPEIIAFLEASDAALGPIEKRKQDDLLHALLALGHMCSERASGIGIDASEKSKAYGVLTVVQGALNTLWAARCSGGPKSLFETLLREPEGEVAKRYRALDFAAECVKEPPMDPRDRPPEELTWMTRLGRSVFMQLGVGLLTTAITFTMLALIAFLDPEGKVFNAPFAAMLMRPSGAADGAPLAESAPQEPEWHSVAWEGGSEAVEPP